MNIISLTPMQKAIDGRWKYIFQKEQIEIDFCAFLFTPIKNQMNK